MPTQEQRDTAYHCEIGKILTAAYWREFTMLEKGKCRTKLLQDRLGGCPRMHFAPTLRYFHKNNARR